ncbi:MAG: hypothetical protein WBL80_06435 [Erysipelotrichaceae bacterium]
MKKLRNLSVFALISTVMLFLLIMPIFASGTDTCSVSSDGTQTCVASSPMAGSGEGSSPGSPGTGIEDPGTVIIPTPGIPMEKTIPGTGVPIEVKPGQDIPAGEVKPADQAPDAVVPGDIITQTPIDEKPATAEDSIGKDDGIRYFANDKSNLAAASDFTGSAIGWVSGLTVLASFAGAAVYAFRSKKNQK